jgi:hypothetical protein
VVDLGLGTNSDGKLGHLILLTAVFFGGSRNAVVAVCVIAFALLLGVAASDAFKAICQSGLVCGEQPESEQPEPESSEQPKR